MQDGWNAHSYEPGRSSNRINETVAWLPRSATDRVMAAPRQAHSTGLHNPVLAISTADDTVPLYQNNKHTCDHALCDGTGFWHLHDAHLFTSTRNEITRPILLNEVPAEPYFRGFEVLTVFWDVASVIRYQNTRCHIPDDRNVHVSVLVELQTMFHVEFLGVVMTISIQNITRFSSKHQIETYKSLQIHVAVKLLSVSLSLSVCLSI
jgi:hypothetical protein